MTVPRLKLNDGQHIPQAGLGTYRLTDADAARLIPGAIASGYRLIDTATIYGNERGVGEAIRAAGVPREDLCVTTKLWNDRQGHDNAVRAAEESLRLLKLDYVDLYLIHWPAPAQGLYVETWRALIELRNRGLARSIGVSNFHAGHLEEIISATAVAPAVNQIELHPLLQQRALRAVHEKHRIAIESWSPLAQGELLHDGALAAIAAHYGKTIAQVVLRWHIEQGLIVIPKSASASRMAENLAIFDFSLRPADRAAIDALDRAHRIGPDPENFS